VINLVKPRELVIDRALDPFKFSSPGIFLFRMWVFLTLCAFIAVPSSASRESRPPWPQWRGSRRPSARHWQGHYPTLTISPSSEGTDGGFDAAFGLGKSRARARP
jgi:hypothetical protein